MDVERDELDAELDVLCDVVQRTTLQPRELEAAKQRVVYAFGRKFSPDVAVPARDFMRLARPTTADALDDEDELTLEEACGRARQAWRLTIDEWPLWLYMLVRRIDDALVARVPVHLAVLDARALYTSLERAYPQLYVMETEDVTRTQRVDNARLVCVPLQQALLCRFDGALHLFAARDADVPHLDRIAAALHCEPALASHTIVDNATVPFDDALLLYLVAEGARLGDAFAQLGEWVRYIDAATVAWVRARVIRSHYLPHFLAPPDVIEITDDESESGGGGGASQRVIEIDDEVDAMDAPILATSLCKLVLLLHEEEDVSDSVLLDVVRYGLHAPSSRGDIQILDPAAWQDRVVVRDQALVMPVGARLLLVPINNAHHWSLLILSRSEAIYYSSWAKDDYGRETVRHIVARHLPALEFRELKGPRQSVDRECSLYVMNMLQYVLDGGQLEGRVRITSDQRRWSRLTVQQLLLQTLRAQLNDARVVRFVVHELFNLALQDAVDSDAFLALLRPLLSPRWPALVRVVERVARSHGVPDRVALEQEMRALVNVAAEAGDDASALRYYAMDDPVDALMQFVRALRDRVDGDESGKYELQPDLFDADYLQEIRDAVAPLSESDAFRGAAQRSVEALFYTLDRRGKRQRLRVPDDAAITDALERYRQYKK